MNVIGQRSSGAVSTMDLSLPRYRGIVRLLDGHRALLPADRLSRHPEYVADFLAEVFGGPRNYSGQRGGHPHMIGKHLNRHLDEAKRRRWVQLLLEAADDVGLPDHPEFRSAFVGYIDWGTRIAVINSQTGTAVESDQPMPKWGWGEVKGPYAPSKGAGGVTL
jgi:hemoglobin